MSITVDGINLGAPFHSTLEITRQITIKGGSPGVGKVLTSDAIGVGTWQLPSSGELNIIGPNSSADGALVRFDGTTGKILQNSPVVMNDTGVIAGITQMAISNIAGVPHVSSILDLQDNARGFLLPRLTAIQRDAISSPARGLMVYDTTNNKTDFFDGTDWQGFLFASASTLAVGSIPFATASHELNDDAALKWDNTLKELTVNGAIIDASGSLVLPGSLTVTGSTTMIATTNVSVIDPLMVLAKGNPGTSLDAGILVELVSPNSNAGWFWDSSASEWVAVFTNDDGTTLGNVIIANYQPIRAGMVNVDNLRLDGNTISSTNLNGDIILSPNGGGVLDVRGNVNVRGPSTGHVTQVLQSGNSVVVAGQEVGEILFDTLDASTVQGTVAFIKAHAVNSFGVTAHRTSLQFGTSDVVADSGGIVRMSISPEGNVIVGAGIPNSTFEVEGSVSKPITTRTAAYTVTSSDYTMLADATAAAFTVSLPTAAGIKGRIYNVKKIDSSINAVSIEANGTETIDGSLTQVLIDQNESITIQSDGSNWFII